MDNKQDITILEQKVRQLENEIKILIEEKDEEAARFYSLYNEMEEEVRRRSSLIQEQNFNLSQEIEKRKEAEHNLRKTIIEKDYLFKELHHRVKNNLQLISSVMNLQIKDSDNEEFKQALFENQQKIRAMAMIHDFIYDSESSDKINLSEYITFLSKEIFSCSVTHFSLQNLDLQINPDIITSLRLAVPCGLVVNELITNSLKHAFSEQKHGTINIHLEEADGMINICISDNGVGFDEEQIHKKNNSLGLNLVKILVENQLKGTLLYSNENGSHFDISIPNRIK